MSARSFDREFFARRGDLRALVPLRIAIGVITLMHLRPFIDAMRRDEYFGDHFNVPYWSWQPQLSKTATFWLLRIAISATVLMTLGVWTRWTTKLTWACVTLNTFQSQTSFHNNRAFLIILLGGLALIPACGGAWSVDARWATWRGQPTSTSGLVWPLWLLRCEVVAVYLGSGTSKLFDRDWFGGRVTWIRVLRVHDHLVDSILPGSVVRLLERRSFHTGAAKVIVATELFIAVGLWFRRTRVAAVWIGIVFHLSIQAVASVQVFSYAGIAALCIWAVPDTRPHTVACADERVARRLRRLDWLGRLDVRVDESSGCPSRRTWREVLSRVPLTFFFVAPFNLVGLRRVWDGR